jgi:hypothetical protein
MVVGGGWVQGRFGLLAKYLLWIESEVLSNKRIKIVPFVSRARGGRRMNEDKVG